MSEQQTPTVTAAARAAAKALMELYDDGTLHCDDFVEAFARFEAEIREAAEAASKAEVERLREALEVARDRLIRIAGRDFDCSPHQHGMAAAGHAQQGVHEIEAAPTASNGGEG